ncbi:MAG: 3-hydroxyacyl-ACP dehydratase FabZ family protein [Pirellulales bacterium]
MRFWLLDAVESYLPNQTLTAVKNVSLTEEYLKDHFPEFPVLPGVFMLEAATQAAAWLLRLSDGMAHSIITLHQAKNIKYANFVTPGKQLRMRVDQIAKDDRLATFKINGEVDGATAVSGRIILERYNLADSDPARAELDERVRNYLRKAMSTTVRCEAAATGE